jgi:hypothetical protein
LASWLGVPATAAVVISFPEDPSEKARLLAECISEAMNCTALVLLVVPIAGLTTLVAGRVVRRAAQDGGPTTPTEKPG